MRVFVLPLLFFLLSGCTSYEQAQRLDGVASVSPTASGVEVRPNLALQVGVPASGTIVLADREETSFGDGYHVTIRLQYLGTDGTNYRFRHTTIHIPPGLRIEEEVKYLLVPAYEAESPNHRLQLTGDARE